MCSTKQVGRYHPPEVRAGINTLEVAKERLQLAAGRAWTDFLDTFGRHYTACKAAVQVRLPPA